DKGYKLVVVVSALGRSPDPYATDTLMSMVDYPEHSYDTKRELDMLMSCGETIAYVVLSNDLQNSVVSAPSLNVAHEGLIIDDNFYEARMKKVTQVRLKY